MINTPDPPKLDTAGYHETPEGTLLRLKVAGPVPRACAWLIDLFIKAGVVLTCSIVLSPLQEIGTGLFLLLLFLVEWFYPVVFELRSGATPGKKVMELRVIHETGTPVTFAASVLRNLLRAADFFPFFYGFGLSAMLINQDFKRLGDLAAGTLVVHEEPKTARQILHDIPPKAPPADLRVNEQRTLLDFSERSAALSPGRRVELAELLSEITGKKGEAAVEELHGYASFLFKGR
jgi:uncharacterized RDD family membrane protein YckC